MRARLLTCIAWLALVTAVPACAGRIDPPYAAGKAPPAAELLTLVAPRISAIQVPSAKVRIGRAPAGNLMLLAQKPGRFSGQVQLAGRELISLAFHEHGYTLRNVAADGLDLGFYSGPPADCAIRRLIGVPFAKEELIALLLGGAPQISRPFEVVDQRWDRKLGHEVLRLRNATEEQELRFAFTAGDWWVAGSTLWHKTASGELERLWTILHEDLRPVDDTILPARTRISRPSGRREERVTITYSTQLPNPDLGGSEIAESDEGGWEDEDTASAPAPGEDDGGWEDGEAPPEGAPPAPADAAPKPAPVKPAGPPKIPPQFTLDSAGLPPRGDLCRNG
jgi:hypothetical protein